MALTFYVPDSTPPPPTIPWTETFTGVNGAAPNTDNWTAGWDGAGEIQNNLLEQDFTGATRGKAIFNWWVTGDFNIYVDFDAATTPTNNGFYYTLSATVSPSPSLTRYQISRAYSAGLGGHKMYASPYLEGVNQGGQLTNSVDSGKLRIARVGSNWTCYYYSDMWNIVGSATLNAGPVTVELLNQYNGTPSQHKVNWDNFTIAAGAIGDRV